MCTYRCWRSLWWSSFGIQIVIKRSERTKRKHATHIQGLELFGVDLKKAAKMMASKFATGASVSKTATGEEEIVIQGDVGDDVVRLASPARGRS